MLLWLYSQSLFSKEAVVNKAMKRFVEALVLTSITYIWAAAQNQHSVYVCDTFNGSDCHMVDSTVMGGVRFEDYKVTNPAAVQFDPSQRVQELAALGTTTADALCDSPPSFTTPAPTIKFDTSSVQTNVYWVPVGPADNLPFEFMDVQFSGLTVSNGFSSPNFGFRMFRPLSQDGSTEGTWYNIQFQGGNPGLLNIPGLPSSTIVGFTVDLAGKTATAFGPIPTSVPLREAILAVVLNASSILSDATVTVSNPAPSGKILWGGAELVSLTSQAQPWVAAAASTAIPIGPPFTCNTTSANGYGVCNGQTEIDAFTNMLLTEGGEYQGLHTQQSFNVLVSNLLSWANANAPSVDPAWLAQNPSSFAQAKYELATSIAMLWPTLRADPALDASDRQTIENWIENWLVPPAVPPDYYPNDLGYWADEARMADAIRQSDNAGFAFGVQRFYGALLQMRADGSFPLATGLSACSAVYSNDDLLELVAMAEMAATQGYDLYSMSVNGNRLEAAIEFMLNAYQNPALLAQYSVGAPPFASGGQTCFEGNPGDPPDFSIYKSPNGNLAWMEPYLARFPLSTTATRLRAILGPSATAPGFPLMINRTGLNATCAFRKPYEFQPFNGASVAIVSGNNQSVGADQPASAPLVVRVTDNSGKPLAGALVSFAVIQGSANVVAPAQVLADATGTASASVTMGPASGPVTVTATALGAPASFSLSVPGPAIASGGIGGIGASVPPVTTITPGSLFSIYGQNFVPAGSGRRVNPDEIVNGLLPTSLLGVCVSVGGQPAPLLDVFPNQINAVAPNVTPSSVTSSMVPPYLPGTGATEVIVTTGCGTPSAASSVPQVVTIAPVAPEFLYLAHNANGQNPVAAENSATGAYVGPTSLGSGFAPAHPGDVVTIFGSGFGATTPSVPPGGVASSAAPAANSVTVTLGGATLDASNILYAGAAPGEPICQLNIRIPAGTPTGSQPIQIVIAGVASPAGAYLAITSP